MNLIKLTQLKTELLLLIQTIAPTFYISSNRKVDMRDHKEVIRVIVSRGDAENNVFKPTITVASLVVHIQSQGLVDDELLALGDQITTLISASDFDVSGLVYQGFEFDLEDQDAFNDLSIFYQITF